MVVALGVTEMLFPVAPVLQVTVPAQPVAVSVTGSLEQIAGLEAVSVGVVPASFTVTTVAGFDAGLRQAAAPQVAVYEVVLVGDTEILAPVAPFDHVTVPAHPVAVSVEVWPAHIVLGAADTTGAFGVPTVTDTEPAGLGQLAPVPQVAV